MNPRLQEEMPNRAGMVGERPPYKKRWKEWPTYLAATRLRGGGRPPVRIGKWKRGAYVGGHVTPTHRRENVYAPQKEPSGGEERDSPIRLHVGDQQVGPKARS